MRPILRDDRRSVNVVKKSAWIVKTVIRTDRVYHDVPTLSTPLLVLTASIQSFSDSRGEYAASKAPIASQGVTRQSIFTGADEEPVKKHIDATSDIELLRCILLTINFQSLNGSQASCGLCGQIFTWGKLSGSKSNTSMKEDRVIDAFVRSFSQEKEMEENRTYTWARLYAVNHNFLREVGL
ncbi:uncharacterized protein LAESUDRAFT_716030 [Laetiporus sulphureus 93-53]|uniref:Uncharacterized protein n=1 Tax=Laetiporus sulphureus 93-53 TaxID=1314785 RepID=A0A165CX71_9APHY|nr:uncharacterized protein LAESUDRAFT_716030 [Laetiporus sulphureus 93-53]KZT03640.1 hypothetical protein LAESUDRAFT_716030 [Laetiporus sulphureus 93-53]